MKASSILLTLKKRVGGETSVVAGTLIVQNGLRLFGSLIMTRLLSVEAFGIIGVITSVVVTFALVSDIGISAFIMRHRGETDTDFANELWTLRLIRSIILTTALLAFSHPIAQFLGKPELQYAIALSSLTFTIDGLDSLGGILALRGRQIRRLSQLDLLTQAINLCFTIALAALLRSYWAILVGNMLGQMLRVWLSYYMFPGVRHRWRFSKDRAREMWKFSRFITGSTIISLIISQADKILLAKVLPLTIFGLYMVAIGLAGVPSGVASAYGGRLLLPRYGEVARHRPGALRAEFYRQKLAFHYLYAAGVGVLAGCAPIVIEILYDHRYQGSAFYLQILLLSSFVSFNNAAINHLMIVMGNSYFTLMSNIVRLSYFAIFGFAGFYFYGPLGLIITVATIEFSAQAYGWITLRKLQLLNLRIEFLTVGTGVLGAATGFLLNMALFWLAHIVGLKVS